ncbi:MAG: ABC transporter ATP-binding protein [Lachnospiraceae bacterium]|nr:ABC transporter ATP-binding protein [Lachnospiraceae bacterium]
MTTLKISGVGKKYFRNGNEFWAVNNIDLTVEQGSFINIIGRSGSGKTTLMNLIAGLLRPSEGEIMVGDKKLNELNDDGLSYMRNTDVSYIMQGNSALKNLTVSQNVFLPYYLFMSKDSAKRHDTAEFKEKEEETMELLKKLGISHLADSSPTKLSGGEVKRMSIARALINHPKIILADEPTGDLDPENTETVLKLFRSIADENVTVISVTHENENRLTFADAIYKMENGKLSKVD